MSEPSCSRSAAGPPLWITMNRPDKINALNGRAASPGCARASGRAAADDEVKVVVLTGAGSARSRPASTSPRRPATRSAGADRWHEHSRVRRRR